MNKHSRTVLCGMLVLAVTLAQVPPVGASSLSHTFFSDMIYVREGCSSARISSYDRSGRNVDFIGIDPGETYELARIDGTGCIRHTYFSIMGTHRYRDLVLRMYWDGEETPSVEVPFGDFFGLGHERVRFFTSLLVTMNRGTGVAGTYGFNSYFPMPFKDGALITLTNDGSHRVGAIWYHLDYEKLDRIDDNVGRFHAQWRRENPTTPVGKRVNVTLHRGENRDGKENYVILEAEGRGNFVGYFLNVDNLVGGWYGEGDDMIFIDGEGWPPSFHGTGSEEIFGGGACPNQEYAGPYTGFHLVGNRDYSGKTSMYRFHVNDPIRFQKSIRVTIEHGHANNMANDYSSCAFWYQIEPHAPFPPLLPASERRPREGTDPQDLAFVRSNELAQKGIEAAQVWRRTGEHIDLADAQKMGEAMRGPIADAFDAGEYEKVVEACDEFIAILDKFLEEHKEK